MEKLFAKYPAVYDALDVGKDYASSVAFAIDQFEQHGNGGNNVLIVGCGTGEHSRRLVEYEFDVLGVDKHEAMVERARTKSDATFRADSLPNLTVEGEFDLIWLPFSVLNYLPPGELVPSLRTLENLLAPEGVLIVDKGDFSEAMPPTLRVASHEGEDYAYLTQLRAGEKVRRWNTIVFTPDGEFFVDSHNLTDYRTETIKSELEKLDFTVETYRGYSEDEPEWPQTVFVSY